MGGAGGQGARTHVPLQAQELQRGSGDFSQDAQVSLCRVGFHAARALGWRLPPSGRRARPPGSPPPGEPGELTPLEVWVSVLNLETPLLSERKAQEGDQEEVRRDAGPAHGPGLGSPCISAPGATPAPPVREEAWPAGVAILGAALGAVFTSRWSPAPAPPSRVIVWRSSRGRGAFSL